jgi:metallo-beta-lactamase family protein
MKLTFWGAARQVTGSMFLLELEDGYRILIDCGFDMEKERNLNEESFEAFPGAVFPFEASSINLVILTHAHIDHSGNIPNLYREGYEGQVLCTAPTAELTNLLLLDSAAIHRRILNSLHKKNRNGRGKSIAQSRINGLYLDRQVEESLECFVDIGFNNRFRVRKGLDVTFNPAGHLLGAANVLLHIEENGVQKSIAFSGDIGRSGYPLLKDPQPLPQVDYLVCESTYGGRIHSENLEKEEMLLQVIKETCMEKPGRLIIPAFSVGRTQALLFTLNKLFVAHRLPPIKIFSDSPLALQSTRTYAKYHRYLNDEARQFMDEHYTLFDFDNLTYVEDLKTSKALSNYREPCIIISSSGMLEGGRIQHHIRANLSNPYCTILMIGYSAEGTLGHQLINGARSVRHGDTELAVMAKIVYTDIFSGHGDHNDLLRFVSSQQPDKLRQLFLVHGEPVSMEALQTALSELGYRHIEIPEKGSEYHL